MHRTHTCGELRIEDEGKEVTLAGWIQTIRKFGGITFIDLRDRYGITQLVLNESLREVLEREPPGREFVVRARGRVVERSNKNFQLATGAIEISVAEFTILNPSKTPPFTIEDQSDGGDDLRMKFRYLDLRRNLLKNNMELRNRVNRCTRKYMDEQGFLDIETPFLIKSTPEGARDFVVPSRMNPGEFYALPQSPQTFKQLLMVSGFDRYYQIVRCFRDEDLRADRQPEFTQIDCEMAFVEQEDILTMFEGLISRIFSEVRQIEFKEPFARISWEEAMWKYGNDKPDIRFRMPLINLKSPKEAYPAFLEILEKSPLFNRITGFRVFDDAETVLGMVVPGGSETSRKDIDLLTDWVKRPQLGMKGLAYIRYPVNGPPKSSMDKFLDEDLLKQVGEYGSATPGSLLLLLAGPEDLTRKAMGELRLHMAEGLGLRNPGAFKLLWVLDFPLFEFDGEHRGWTARHHPFTAPQPQDTALLLQSDPALSPGISCYHHPYYRIRANAYDLVLNGIEIGGGSIRIHRRELQEKMFEALGLSPDETAKKFGFLLGAFEYGAPPHGGIALGFDRLCALLGGMETIRDFIAFPKNNSGRDTMLDAPSAIGQPQLEELHLSVKK
jgi:aspartyl-tRNA synthetase